MRQIIQERRLVYSLKSNFVDLFLMEQLQMKAICVVAFCGGQRCADLVSLETSGLEFNDVTECWVKYVVSKQRGENMVNKFNVPLNYVQYLTQYCDVLKEADLYIGRLFKS